MGRGFIVVQVVNLFAIYSIQREWLLFELCL
jgi:hypothetical protein